MLSGIFVCTEAAMFRRSSATCLLPSFLVISRLEFAHANRGAHAGIRGFSRSPAPPVIPDESREYLSVPSARISPLRFASTEIIEKNRDRCGDVGGKDSRSASVLRLQSPLGHRHSKFFHGGIAQLVERQLCKLDVRGSNPLASIFNLENTGVAKHARGCPLPTSCRRQWSQIYMSP